VARRAKVATKEPTIEEIMAEVKADFADVKFVAEQLDQSWDIQSLTDLYRFVGDDNADELFLGLKLARDIVVELCPAESKPSLADVLAVFELTDDEDEDD